MEYQLLFRTLQYPKASASVDILDISPRDGYFVEITVRLTDYIPPLSGVWCIWLTGGGDGEVHELLCKGDFKVASDWFPSSFVTSHVFSMEGARALGGGARGDEFEVAVTLQTGDIEFNHVAYKAKAKFFWGGRRGDDEL